MTEFEKNRGKLRQTAFETNAGGLNQPLRPLSDPTFELWHFALSRGAYDQVFKEKNKALQSANRDLRLKMYEPHGFSAEELRAHVAKVGHEYGWDRRGLFQPANEPYLQAIINEPQSRLYVFERRENGHREDIGFCFVTGIPPLERPYTDDHVEAPGLASLEAVNMFKATQRLEAAAVPIEINKIGLYPEYTNRGIGNFYLAKMLEILFEREGFNIVYLNSRDTNHRGIESFYRKNGIEIFHRETLPSDLVPNAPSQAPIIHSGDRRYINGDTEHHASTPANDHRDPL
ncbi:MAG: GNAT family N-acetyltransferase [Alphaproteobacteria bacterium]|nr:GNAT family N-acetyltransferase [Alphaproteobacteria bacterium]